METKRALHTQSLFVSRAASALVQAHLETAAVRLTITTGSMSPALRPGDQVTVRKVNPDELRLGDVVVFQSAGAFVAHRLIARSRHDGQLFLTTKGDAAPEADAPWEPSALVGVIVARRRGDGETSLETRRVRTVNRMLAFFSQGHQIVNQTLSGAPREVVAKGLRGGLKVLSALLLVLLAVLFVLPDEEVSAAVTVSSFAVKAQGNQVQASWVTATEINNVGFNILRSTAQSGTYVKVNANLIPSQCLGCVAGANYSYTDASAAPGQTFFYKLQAVDNKGGTQLFGPATTAGAPGATSTSAPPTATKTSAPPPRTATHTPSPKTSTYTPVPPTSTPTLVPIASPTRTTVQNPAQPPAASAPPATKVAVVRPASTAARTTAPLPAPAQETAQPSPMFRAIKPSPATDVSPEQAGEEIPVEQPAESGASGADAFSNLALLGTVGALGCGSAVFGGLAILVLARAMSRR